MAKSRGRGRARQVETGISDGVKQAISAILLITAGLLIGLSIAGSAGVVGMYINDALTAAFGFTRIFLSIALVLIGWNVLFPSRALFGTGGYIGLLFFFVGFSGLLNLLMIAPGTETAAAFAKAGGYIGLLISAALVSGIGPIASGVIAFVFIAIAVILMFEITFDHMLQARDAMAERVQGMRDDMGPLLSAKERSENVEAELDEDDTVLIDPDQIVEEAPPSKKPVDDIEVEEEDQDDAEQVMTSKRSRKIQIPIELLEERSSEAVPGDIEKNEDIIKKTFAHFNIEVEMVETRVGPTVAQYALKPQQGVKLAKILSLQNDLALALAAHPIRIEAPIPGKSLVGIEVPNQTIGSVGLRQLLESKEFKTRKSSMMAPLGIDVSGNVISLIVDKAPHMLVAGATGSGKSVCLNTIITSLLYQNGPDDLKLIMVDPKRVELGRYAGIPHLLTPPITKPEEAINALKWAVREMERRLDHLAKFGVRDIDAYNVKSKEQMPKIVIIIDELADLMSTSNRRDVEAVIVRLAQMARAAGIHLILATQRPSVDVITGIIKANIPTRLAFAVASQVDSKTILDISGAEKLLGRGDMLVHNPQISKPKRLQGAFVADDEIEHIVDFLKKEGAPDYNMQVLEHERTGGTAFNEEDSDPLLDDAIQIIIESGKASTSYLQRRMRIGYSRAARLIDLMEEVGVIGGGNGAKAREVLVTEWPPQRDRVKDMPAATRAPLAPVEDRHTGDEFEGEENDDDTLFDDMMDEEDEPDEEDRVDDENKTWQG
jgi:S-DNA-T family DNA segregation ATPase FtsK/SpoIIIE